jgi:ParB/RepB/Spo0J family partition protein
VSKSSSAGDRSPKNSGSDSQDLLSLLQQQAAREQTMHRPPSVLSSPQQRERLGRDVDESTVWLQRDRIDPNPNQPRRLFKPDELRSLGESLRQHGQLQALVVRPHPQRQGRYEIVSGERRWRAAAPEYGDLERLRATIRDLSDQETLRLALIENVHRENLTALEKARALRVLQLSPHGDKSLSLRDLEAETKLRKSHIQRLLALLDLPEKLQQHMEDLDLNEAHGRALLMLRDDKRAQKSLLAAIRNEALSGNEALRRVTNGATKTVVELSNFTTHKSRFVSSKKAPLQVLPDADFGGEQMLSTTGFLDQKFEPIEAFPEFNQRAAAMMLQEALDLLQEARDYVSQSPFDHKKRPIMSGLISEIDDLLSQVKPLLG